MEGLGNMIALSCENGDVQLWSEYDDGWKKSADIKVGIPAWRVNWSSTGNILAVSCGEEITKLYKEGQKQWEELPQ